MLTRGTIEGVTTIATPQEVAALDAVQYLYVEGGAQTAAAFLDADLVDRIELYRAPVLIGGDDVLAATRLNTLENDGGWAVVEQRQLGSDSYAAYSRAR